MLFAENECDNKRGTILLEAVNKLHKMIVFVFNLLYNKIERTPFYILSFRKKKQVVFEKNRTQPRSAKQCVTK